MHNALNPRMHDPRTALHTKALCLNSDQWYVRNTESFVETRNLSKVTILKQYIMVTGIDM